MFCLASSSDYEEDFEADDEGPADEAEAKEEKSPSPSSETQVNGKDASETEDDEKDGGCSLSFRYICGEQWKTN